MKIKSQSRTDSQMTKSDKFSIWRSINRYIFDIGPSLIALVLSALVIPVYIRGWASGYVEIYFDLHNEKELEITLLCLMVIFLLMTLIRNYLKFVKEEK